MLFNFENRLLLCVCASTGGRWVIGTLIVLYSTRRVIKNELIQPTGSVSHAYLISVGGRFKALRIQQSTAATFCSLPLALLPYALSFSISFASSLPMQNLIPLSLVSCLAWTHLPPPLFFARCYWEGICHPQNLSLREKLPIISLSSFSNH